jgi:hypothetical protein
MELYVRPERYAICRLPGDAPTPVWPAGPLLATIRLPDELTIVCVEESVPVEVESSPGWSVLAVAGPLAHDLVGVLAGIAGTLRDAGIPIFAISTFDTDLILVPGERLDDTAVALRDAGHVVRLPGVG